MALPKITQEINTIKSTYLPKSGGTITGAISGKSGMLFGTTDTSDIYICGGTKSSNNSFIQLNGGQHPDNAGQIFISPWISSSNGCVWTMKPNGSIVCSSTNSSITVSKLVIGGLTITDGFIKGSGGSSIGAHLYSGSNNFDGASLQLYRRALGSYPGHFYLRTSSKSSSGDTAGASYDIVGKPDGTLTWGGKHIVRNTAASNGANGYRKYSDGLIVQWGTYTNTSTSGTITLPVAFSNTNYSAVIAQQGNNADTGGWGGGVALNPTKTTTTITYSVQESCKITWIAIGY